uniref:EF-hand domain-containing protein n=1 Tax=Panagrellus redivivus TaxID=6233 RepID=A0A7E4VX04_PANRE
MYRFGRLSYLRFCRRFRQIGLASAACQLPRGLATVSAYSATGFATAGALRAVVLSSRDDDDDTKLSKRQQRFRDFASVEFNGVEYMSPQDFLDSLILDEPRERVFRRVVDEKQVNTMLKSTPPLRRGSSKLFRYLGQNGLISYAEYVFLLTLFTKSQQAFTIAFIMFDDDDNHHIDKREFLKIRSLILILPSVCTDDYDLDCQLTGFLDSSLPVLPHKSQHEASPPPPNKNNGSEPVKQDTTIVVHLFGQSGRDSLSFAQFQEFYGNLQREIIEIEFQEFSRGKNTISAVDFARLVLRYSIVDKTEQSPYLKRVFERTSIDDPGISLHQFEVFSMFLNNIDEFTKAVKLYTAADLPVSRTEFIRAVKCSTGHQLDPKLVDVLYAIFDANGDDRLSYSEFIAIMNDRLHRGLKTQSSKKTMFGWQAFRDCVLKESA